MRCKCIDALVREHKMLLRIVDVLDSISAKAKNQSPFDSRDVEAVVRLLRAFGDGFHQAKEENDLFPVFTAAGDATQYADVRHMLFEHQQDRALISGLMDAVARSDTPQFADYSAQLSSALRNHIFKEDNVLFETIDSGLSAQDDARVTAKFESIDRSFAAQKTELLNQFRHLEWKYLRKIA